jgi:hypothetical protein
MVVEGERRHWKRSVGWGSEGEKKKKGWLLLERLLLLSLFATSLFPRTQAPLLLPLSNYVPVACQITNTPLFRNDAIPEKACCLLVKFKN